VSTAAGLALISGQEQSEAEYQQLMKDIFHELSQPLSTLTCLLEVNLLMPRPAKRTRHDLQIALKQTHSVMRLIRGLRELVEAGDAQQDQQTLNLTDCLVEAVADLLPVAEKQSVKLVLVCEAGSDSTCLVRFQASRLRPGLLRLLEFTLEGCSRGTELQITAAADRDAVRVTVAVPTESVPEAVIAKAGAVKTRVPASDGSADIKQRELKRRVRLAIARRIFEGAAGRLMVLHGTNGLCLEVCLPLVPPP
jgi:signal transduction histidine kinase